MHAQNHGESRKCHIVAFFVELDLPKPIHYEVNSSVKKQPGGLCQSGFRRGKSVRTEFTILDYFKSYHIKVIMKSLDQQMMCQWTDISFIFIMQNLCHYFGEKKKKSLDKL